MATNDPSTGREGPEDLPLAPGEPVLGRAVTQGALLVATERRMAVIVGKRVALDVTYPALRRIQFDIERQRPATLVVVPESSALEPQVISVRAEEYGDVADVLVTVGRFLAET